jgi:hypothetical protein
MFSLQQNWRRGQNRFCLEVREVGLRGRGKGAGGKMAQAMYTHMNKCINNFKKENSTMKRKIRGSQIHNTIYFHKYIL